MLVTVAAALRVLAAQSGASGSRPWRSVLLVALYAIPAVALDFENEFLRGAALALLVLAFLRLEKLRVGDAGNAGIVAAGVAVLALMLAPALDSDQPWWDYESWALDAASARVDLVLLEPRLRPARLAARRPRAAARPRPAARRLLEGGEPRRVRRPPLASRRRSDFEDPSAARRRGDDESPARSGSA